MNDAVQCGVCLPAPRRSSSRTHLATGGRLRSGWRRDAYPPADQYRPVTDDCHVALSRRRGGAKRSLGLGMGRVLGLGVRC